MTSRDMYNAQCQVFFSSFCDKERRTFENYNKHSWFKYLNSLTVEDSYLYLSLKGDIKSSYPFRHRKDKRMKTWRKAINAEIITLLP